MIFRIFLFFPDFPKICHWLTQGRISRKIRKSGKIRFFSDFRDGHHTPSGKKSEIFGSKKIFFSDPKICVCGLPHCEKSENFRKKSKNLAFPGLCGPKGPGLPGFSPKNTPKIFPPYHPPDTRRVYDFPDFPVFSRFSEKFATG